MLQITRNDQPQNQMNSEGIWSPTPMPLQVPFGDFWLGAKGVPVFLLAVALWALKIDLATEVLMLPGRDGNVEMCLKMIQPSRQFLIVHSTWTFREFQRRHSGMSWEMVNESRDHITWGSPCRVVNVVGCPRGIVLRQEAKHIPGLRHFLQC